MEEEIAAKSQASQGRKNLKNLRASSGLAKTEENIAAKAQAKHSAETLSNVIKARSNPTSLQQTEQELQAKAQAAQSAQMMKTAASSSNRSPKSRLDEGR
jgi:hypothetical protein